MTQTNRGGADLSRRPVPCAYCGAPAGTTKLETEGTLHLACSICVAKFLRGEALSTPCEPVDLSHYAYQEDGFAEGIANAKRVPWTEEPTLQLWSCDCIHDVKGTRLARPGHWDSCPECGAQRDARRCSVCGKPIKEGETFYKSRRGMGCETCVEEEKAEVPADA